MELPTWQQHKRNKRTDNQVSLSGQAGVTRNVAAMLIGRRLLNKMLGNLHRNIVLSDLSRAPLKQLLVSHGATTLADLYEAVGTGKLPASTVLRYFLSTRSPDP